MHIILMYECVTLPSVVIVLLLMQQMLAEIQIPYQCEKVL